MRLLLTDVFSELAFEPELESRAVRTAQLLMFQVALPVHSMYDTVVYCMCCINRIINQIYNCDT